MIKHKLVPAKDWIIKNQNKSGSIYWDHRGKCDPWDHCECLIALAIYEEWDAFNKGIEWFFNNLNAEVRLHRNLLMKKFLRDIPKAIMHHMFFFPFTKNF